MKILILGAGINQLTLIQSAQELGVISVVIDPNPKALGKEIANYFYCIAGDDYEATKEIAIKHNVNGIVTSQMERPLKLMARLAAELGFIFHSVEVVEKSLNKYLMKQAFIKNDVPHANGMLIKSNEKINEINLKIFKFPLMLKPKDAFSSRGVYKIDKFQDIKKHIKETRYFSSNGDIVIEEFMAGPEFSIESITYKGKTKIIQYTEKFITPFPNTVEMGHLQPANLTEIQQKEIDKVVKQAINAIGIDNSATHTEVKLTKDGPKVLEIGARLGGDFIASYLTLNSCGVNMDKVAIKVSLGMKPNLQHTLNQYSYIKYFELPIGKKVMKINNLENINKNKNVVFTHIDIEEGDTVPQITHSAQRPGFVIVKGKSRNEVIKRAEHYEEKLKNKIILE